MSFTLVPMLLAGQSISPDARQALRENRLEDAAQLLMREYGLTRAETNDLLRVSLCPDPSDSHVGPRLQGSRFRPKPNSC